MKLKAGPTRPRITPKKNLEVRIQRNEVRMVKMRLWGPFIGHYMAWAAQHTFSGHRVCLAHLKWPSVNIDQSTQKKGGVFGHYQGAKPEEILP